MEEPGFYLKQNKKYKPQCDEKQNKQICNLDIFVVIYKYLKIFVIVIVVDW